MAPWSCSASAMARTYCVCFLLIARRLSASAWFAVLAVSAKSLTSAVLGPSAWAAASRAVAAFAN